jgi:hypothetical protein
MRVLAPLLFVLASAPAAAAELDWLAGHWCNADTEELWLPEREGLLLGVNRARAGKPAFEFLRIEIVDGKARYLAQPGGRPPTAFDETARAAQRIDFGNPQHDFPKRIRYWREGEVLHAAIDDGSEANALGFRWEACGD